MKSLAKTFLIFSIVSALGCGSSNPKTVKVSGKVLHGGKPVVHATVSYLPAGGGGRPASGITDESGAYQLTTFTANDGALPGKYAITVNPAKNPVATGAVDVTKMATAEDYAAAMGKGVDPTRVATSGKEDESEVPLMYRTGSTSPLMKDVSSQGPNQFDLLVD